MKLFGIIMLIVTPSTSTLSYQGIVDNWLELGWSSVNALHFKARGERLALMKAAVERNVTLGFGSRVKSRDFHCLLTQGRGDLEDALKALLDIRPFGGMIVAEDVTKEVFELSLKRMGRSMAGFLIVNSHFHRFISLKHEKIVLFDAEKSNVWTDFRGSTLHSNGAEWKPVLNIDNCDQDGECDISGYLVDMMKVFEGMFNFTLDFKAERVWGIMPVNGVAISHPDAEFVGFFGSAIKDEVDFLMSFWLPTIERTRLVDFSDVVIFGTYACFLTDIVGDTAFDVFVLLRPFSKSVWTLFFACAAFALGLSSIKANATKSKATNFTRVENSEGFNAVSFGLLFSLLLAYYGGALTMFFSVGPSLPFSNLKEALSLYPTWRPLLTSAVLLPTLVTIAPDNVKSAIAESPIHEDVEDLVRRQIEVNHNHFSYCADFSIMGVKDKFPDVEFKRIPCNNKPGPYVFILPKGSPLTPTFNLGTHQMRQSGLIEQIKRKWMKTIEAKSSTSPAFALSAKHVAIVFSVLAAAFVIAPCILFVERRR